MKETILDIQNLRTYFYVDKHPVPAVDGIDFSLSKGEILGIVGESGCGKSVTAMSILQLLPPKQAEIQSGSKILFKGANLAEFSNVEMQAIRGNEISMIFQDSMTSLNPVKTIRSQMVHMYKLHNKLSTKEAERRSIEMLGKMGIPSPEDRIKAYPHQLSGGMRQRVLIAMALSCEPEVLIADEPTTALDVTIQQQILDLMLDIRKRNGTSIILITHDMGVVSEMADSIVVMYCGNIVEYANTRSIFEHPRHPYTKALLASIPRINGEEERLFSIKGSVPNWNNMPKGCKYCTRCSQKMEICEKSRPDLYSVGEAQVRCFLYKNKETDAI